MAVTIDNIELDKDNVEFNNAAEFVRHTDKLFYLTGKAGTGKTTFLKYIKDITDKNAIILAPTGVAAINAGGVTIHSFFQIPFGPFLPDDPRLQTQAKGTDSPETIYKTFKYNKVKVQIIRNLELLFIDEISMVRADVLDVIDRILRVFRKKPQLPFGGVQVILIGDTFQLSPVADKEQWSILSQFYKTPFFFSSRVVTQNKPIFIELKTIYRQKEKEFIDLLNRVRINQLRSFDWETLDSKYNPTFSDTLSDYIVLATHNSIVNDINRTKLNELETKLFTFEANVNGDFPDRIKPTDHYLDLKVGAQIMFVKNDTGEFKRYFNGKIGKVKELEENSIRVVFDNESEVNVNRAIWNNIRYTYNKDKRKVEEEVIGTFQQFPIRLAWAITVHKSQGLTFEKVIADLGGAFAPGQVYVALSRCTSLSGLQLRTKISQHAISTDPDVLEFAQNETPDTLITEHLNTGKADFYYKKAREHFTNADIKSSFEYFKRALKFRNDIDTENFEKFIVIQGRRLMLYREKLIKSVGVERHLNDEIFDLNQTVERKSQEISYKAREIDSQKSAIEHHLTKEIELENQNEALLKDIASLKKKLSNRQSKLTQLESQLERSVHELASRNKENESIKLELERLRKLSWVDKLFGKS